MQLLRRWAIVGMLLGLGGLWGGVILWARVTPITDVVVTGSATLVRAANASRTALSCTNHDSSVAVRWGNSTVTSTKGQRLPAGLSIEIKDLAAVYMVSEDTDVTVSCTEETKQ